jgi:hypothetical protein
VETIVFEAERNTKVTLDLDNLRYRYTDIDLIRGLEVIFPDFEIFTYEINFFNLIYRSIPVTFKPRWDRRPDYASFDLYGTNIFWTLLLFLNQIHSIEDFTNLETIIYPPYNSIVDLVKDKISEDAKTLYKEVNLEEARYYKIYPLDEREKSIIDSRRNLDDFFGGGGVIATPIIDWEQLLCGGCKVHTYRYSLPGFTDPESGEIEIPNIPINGKMHSFYVITNLTSFDSSLRSKSGSDIPGLDEIYFVRNINREYLENQIDVIYKNTDDPTTNKLYLNLINHTVDPCGGGLLEIQLYVT